MLYHGGAPPARSLHFAGGITCVLFGQVAPFDREAAGGDGRHLLRREGRCDTQ